MNRRISLGATLSALVLVRPLATLAQSGTENYYYPPTIATFGKSSLPISGRGKVIVKVLVKADGTFAVQNVLRSSNAGDNAAALDIAKHSTYHPATRGTAKKPVTAFYDFTVNFTGTSASSGATGAADAAAGGALTGYESEMRGGKYASARSGLENFVQAHPSDQKALLDLALAQVFMNDFTAAAATFDKMPSVPSDDRAIAAKAYTEASTSAYTSKQFPEALADAKKATALEPGPYTYNSLGMAEEAGGDQTSAIADLQRAHDSAGSLKAKDRVGIDVNLLGALTSAGKNDQAAPIRAEISSLDPSNASLATLSANESIKAAQTADAAQNYTEAEADWSKAAVALPQQAAPLYARAAIDEENKKSGSDPAKAKSLVEMALAADPNNALANYASGYVLAKQGNKADATTALNKAEASAKAAGDTSLVTNIENLLKQLSNS